MNGVSGMYIERVWARPSARTFSMPPVARLIAEESAGCETIIE